MTSVNVQFSVAVHILAVLASRKGEGVTSATLAASVNADATFVRRTVSKLSKADIVVATRGKKGACVLSRAPEEISLLDVYRASDAPLTFAIHGYPVAPTCPISVNIKDVLSKVLEHTQNAFEASLVSRTLADVMNDLKGRGALPELYCCEK